MAARRAILDSETLEDPTLMAFQRGSARRAFADDETDDVLCSVASASAARRVVAEPISFDPDEPLTSTRRLPRITETVQPAKAAKDSVRLRRGLLGVAAAATASAALVLPSAMSTVTAQPATIDAATVERTVAVSRSVAVALSVLLNRLYPTRRSGLVLPKVSSSVVPEAKSRR